MEEKTVNDYEQARQWVAWSAPLTPYWEGRTFEDTLEVAIHDLPSEADRVALYERLFALIDRDDPRVQHQALSRLSDAYRAELWEDEADQPAHRIGLYTRLEGILAAVEQRLPGNPKLLEQFCSHFTPTLCGKPEIEQIRDWLNRFEASGVACPVPAAALLAARILYSAYGATWKEAGERLLTALDQEDLTIRACAAYQIGTFCRRLAPENSEEDWRRDLEEDRRATDGMDSLANCWELIRNKEIERSGVAGAFWNGAPKWTIDADEWILTLLVVYQGSRLARHFRVS